MAKASFFGLRAILDIKDIKKTFSKIASTDLLKMRDGERIADSAISLILWERQAGGEQIFSNSEVLDGVHSVSVYNPAERISYYTRRGNKYIERSVKHGFKTVLSLVKGFLPKIVITILEIIFKLIK